MESPSPGNNIQSVFRAFRVRFPSAPSALKERRAQPCPEPDATFHPPPAVLPLKPDYPHPAKDIMRLALAAPILGLLVIRPAIAQEPAADPIPHDRAAPGIAAGRTTASIRIDGAKSAAVLGNITTGGIQIPGGLQPPWDALNLRA